MCAVRAGDRRPAVRVGGRQLSGGGRHPAPAPATRAAFGTQPPGRRVAGRGGADRAGQGPRPAVPERERAPSALERVLAGDAVAAGPGRPGAAAVPTEPLPGLPARTGVLAATTGPAVRDAGRRPGWPRWALAVGGWGWWRRYCGQTVPAPRPGGRPGPPQHRQPAHPPRPSQDPPRQPYRRPGWKRHWPT
jgi:hypothetical protein